MCGKNKSIAIVDWFEQFMVHFPFNTHESRTNFFKVFHLNCGKLQKCQRICVGLLSDLQRQDPVIQRLSDRKLFPNQRPCLSVPQRANRRKNIRRIRHSFYYYLGSVNWRCCQHLCDGSVIHSKTQMENIFINKIV